MRAGILTTVCTHKHLFQVHRLHAGRQSRLLETWCLMEYAERGSLADSLRTGRLRRADSGLPDLACIVQCLQDLANGALSLCAQMPSYKCKLAPKS